MSLSYLGLRLRIFKFIYFLKSSVLGEYDKNVLRSYEPATKIILVFFPKTLKNDISPIIAQAQIDPRYYHSFGRILYIQY